MNCILYRIVQILMVTGVIIATIIYPLLIIVSLISKHLLFYVASKFHNFKEPVKGVSNFLSPDKVFVLPNATLMHVAILSSTPKRNVILQHMQTIYDLRRDDRRKYAKLGWTVDRFCGYLFWKECPDFKIEERIHFLQEEMNADNISEFVENLIRKPFEKEKPLWEMFVIESSTNECFVVFRTHHLLLDGMSLIKLWYLMDHLSENDESESEISSEFENCLPESLFRYKASTLTSDKSYLQSTLDWVKILLQSGFVANKYLLTPGDRNCLTNPHKDLNGPWYCSGLNKIHVEGYRQPIRKLGFTLTHVLLVGFTRGLKSFIEKNYGGENVPKSVHILGSIPRPNYPREESLTNHWAIMRYKAKLTWGKQETEENNLFKELEYAQREYQRSVQDKIPKAFEHSSNIGIGLCPIPLYQALWDTVKSGTLSLSNIPGPPKWQKMFGERVKNRGIWLPLTRNNSGIGLLMLTYNGSATICLTADSGCIKTRELFNSLNSYVMKEMQFVLDEVLQLSMKHQDEEVLDSNHNTITKLSSDDTLKPFSTEACELQEIKIIA